MAKDKEMHPNSLKNLRPLFTPENAKEYQLKAAASRKANTEARQALKMSAQEFSKYKEELREVDISAETMLKVLMMQAYDRDDLDTAADLAKSLVEFEKPKLARVDQTTTDLSAEEMTDEELNELLRKHVEKQNEL